MYCDRLLNSASIIVQEGLYYSDGAVLRRLKRTLASPASFTNHSPLCANAS